MQELNVLLHSKVVSQLMSALGQKQTLQIATSLYDVCFTPNSGHCWRQSPARPHT